jgi:hypothetical protein
VLFGDQVLGAGGQDWFKALNEVPALLFNESGHFDFNVIVKV